jgi:hypothetical protein
VRFYEPGGCLCVPLREPHCVAAVASKAGKAWCRSPKAGPRAVAAPEAPTQTRTVFDKEFPITKGHTLKVGLYDQIGTKHPILRGK